MAQQIFDQYAPLAKVSANETIPVVAAIAQTRDGKDELLHGTVPFVPAGGLYVPVSAANRLPVEATLSGPNVDDPQDVLSPSYVRGSDGAGLLMMYMASRLSADQDTVSLGGLIANSLQRQPRFQRRIRDEGGATRTLAAQEDHIVFETDQRVILNWLDFWADQSFIGFQIAQIEGGTMRPWEFMGATGRGAATIGQMHSAGGNPVWNIEHHEQGGYWRVHLSRPFEFPEGVRVLAKNYRSLGSPDVVSFSYSGSYLGVDG